MTFKLQRIVQACVAAMLTACLILTSVVVVSNLSAYRRHERAVAEFDRFALSIRLMAAVSAERGPANLLIGQAAAPTADGRAKLAEARAKVDGQFEALVERFEEELGTRSALREDARLLREALAEGRQAVDDAADTPPDRRETRRNLAAVRAMFTAADRAQILRERVGEVMVDLSPELMPLLLTVVAVSDLREYAGRLGSVVVMRIDAGRDFDDALAGEFVSMLALTETLFRQIGQYAGPFVRDEEIERALKRVTFGYITGARAYAETAFANVRAGADVSASDFSSRYVPGLRTTEVLRERILDVGRATLVTERDRSLTLAVVSVAGALAGGFLLVAAFVVLERGVFRPLLLSRQRMARILSGDLEPGGEATASSFIELTQLDEDIERLRRQQIELRRLESEREAMSQELRRLATTDPLTGLLNRRAFEDGIADLLAAPDRLGAGLGLVMIDIDHFKSINDRFGHGAGDEILRGIGQILAHGVPNARHVARIGGEEFVLAIADIDRRTLEDQVEAVRARIEAADLLPRIRLRVTASFGVHWVPAGKGLAWDELHRGADRCLYEAKHGGRNRVASSA